MDSGFFVSMMAKCINFMFRSKPPEVTIQSLPDEIILHIFHYLELEDVLECERVCRRWRNLATDSGLWRSTQIVCTSQCGKVCPETVRIIKTHSDIVRNLKMQYILKYPFLSSLTGLCHNLLSLEMVMCRIQVEIEEDLKRWPNLKKLNLKNSMLKSNRTLLLPLDHCKELTHLTLSDFGLTTDNCNSLLQCNHLNNILIDKILGLDLEFIKTLISTKQETLSTFHIYGGDAVNDDCLMMLAQCPKLQDLSIKNCENLTDRALDGVSKIESLTHLQLWNNHDFTESKLKATLLQEHLRKLRRLSFSKVENVTGAIVDIISEYYTNLKFLALYRCPRISRHDHERQLKAKFRNIEIVLY